MSSAFSFICSADFFKHFLMLGTDTEIEAVVLTLKKFKTLCGRQTIIRMSHDSVAFTMFQALF